MNKVIIFLDFDGVLHPYFHSRGQLFQRIPLLVDALRRYPNKLSVVISSTWRETVSLEDMKARFPEDIQDLIIGVTPSFSDISQAEIEAKFLPTSWRDIDALEGTRQSEIVYWLRTNRPQFVPWIAIDDTASGFSPNCQDLLLVKGPLGIDMADIQTLHAMIRIRLDEL